MVGILIPNYLKLGLVGNAMNEVAVTSQEKVKSN
jgi:hypothetical protein